MGLGEGALETYNRVLIHSVRLGRRPCAQARFTPLQRKGESRQHGLPRLEATLREVPNITAV